MGSRARIRQTQAFAPGTRKNHFSHLKSFLAFAAYYALPSLPASTHTSLKFHHARLGFTLHPFDSFQLKLALRSLPFTLRTPTAPAAPFPAQLLAPLCTAAAALGPWAAPFRALCLLAFFSFARLASLVPPSGGAFEGSRFPTLGDLELHPTLNFCRG